MGIIVWIIFGTLAGWVASLLYGTNEDQGALGNIVVGIMGAVLGGLIMNMFGYSGISGFDPYSLLVAVLGSVMTLWIYRTVSIKV